MAQQIRGATDDSTRMMLGQIRKVFDPAWIQAFEQGGFTIQFEEKPDCEEELANFADMYGHSLTDSEDRVWHRYYFD